MSPDLVLLSAAVAVGASGSALVVVWIKRRVCRCGRLDLEPGLGAGPAAAFESPAAAERSASSSAMTGSRAALQGRGPVVCLNVRDPRLPFRPGGLLPPTYLLATKTYAFLPARTVALDLFWHEASPTARAVFVLDYVARLDSMPGRKAGGRDEEVDRVRQERKRPPL